MNPFLGIFLHAIGGFSSASFYVPINKVQRWAWETYWITLGFVAWVVMPWIGAYLTTPDLWGILSSCPHKNLFWTYFFGVLWGIGGLSCGLSLRYLGLSLGQSISLGFCAAFGTLIPPIFAGDVASLFGTASGLIVMAGIVICLAGITMCGYAGALKERQLTPDQKKEAVKDFAFIKGFSVAVFGGIMSASMAFALTAGKPIAQAALEAGTASIYQNNPVLIVALAGGFTTNFICCTFLKLKNKTMSDFVAKPDRTLLRNYLLAFLSGAMWYGQYFFYGMGTTKMGKYDFASWSIHMAFIIVFSNFWGIYLKEWKLVNSKTKMILLIGILVLIASTFMIGIGNSMAAEK